MSDLSILTGHVILSRGKYWLGGLGTRNLGNIATRYRLPIGSMGWHKIQYNTITNYIRFLQDKYWCSVVSQKL